MSQMYVISAVGKDKPGLVYSVSNVLSELNINIVDVDARSVRGHFSMFIVIDLSTSEYGFEKMYTSLKPLESNFNLGLNIDLGQMYGHIHCSDMCTGRENTIYY